MKNSESFLRGVTYGLFMALVITLLNFILGWTWEVMIVALVLAFLGVLIAARHS